MHARNRTWTLGSDPAERCRQRTLPVEGGDGSTLSLDFTTGVLDPRLTFSRDGGGTYIGNDGRVYGMDFDTSSSLAIGTGSKSVTLTATAGVDRRYLVGQTVWISNGANNMRGPVTAYDASTQVLTIDATGTSGSGSFTSWTVGNASARFDYDQTTLAPRGLLIEGSATNLVTQSSAMNNWTFTRSTASTPSVTAPDGASTSVLVTGTADVNNHSIQNANSISFTSQNYTFSVWLKAGATNFAQLSFTNAVGFPTNTFVNVDLSNGTLGTVNGSGATATISTVYPNGWYRVTLTANQTSITSHTGSCLIYLVSSITAGRAESWDASSASVYVFGAQLEAGSGASSYIPTGASQGSRAADSLVIQDGAWRNTANIDSTWYVDGVLNKMNTAFNSVFDVVGNGGYTERNRIFISATGSQVRFTHYARSASVNPDFEYAINQASPNGYVYGSRFKVAATFDNTAGENRSSWNGATSNGTTAAACTTTPTYFTITVGSGNDWHFRSIKYWPLSLPQTTLNGITTL